MMVNESDPHVLVFLFIPAQVVTLLYYLLSYFPGGSSGLKFMLTMLGNAVSSCFSSASQSVLR
jgi:hypothetical protein